LFGAKLTVHPLEIAMLFKNRILFVMSCLSFSWSALAEPVDFADQAIYSGFKKSNGDLLCAQKDSNLAELRNTLNPFIAGIDVNKEESYKQLQIAVYTAFPCPFSPKRPGLNLATKNDLLGQWSVPEESIKFRHGPRSSSWRFYGGNMVKCEAISFYESSEYRVATVSGTGDCPDLKLMDVMRSMPLVTSWSMLRDGRFKVSRIEDAASDEEWDAYVVKEGFEFSKVRFEVGDLLLYSRKERGNDVNASTMFRRLVRLK
jgi:hypothetical protein